MMQMPGAFAEFERAMLRERTKAGLEALAGKGASAGAVQSSGHSSSLKSLNHKLP
jgi:DNA invertase Pin-like site-specific DNA recombinase